MDQIINDFGKGLKQLGQETAEKLVEETGKIVEPIITAQELLGDIKPLSEEEMAKKRAEDEEKRRKEISDVRFQISGRRVENEMEQIRHQREKEEDKKEKIDLEKARRQGEIENRQQMESVNLMVESSNPAKQKKSRGDAFGRKKKSQPDQSKMSQTSEFKGKLD